MKKWWKKSVRAFGNWIQKIGDYAKTLEVDRDSYSRLAEKAEGERYEACKHLRMIVNQYVMFGTIDPVVFRAAQDYLGDKAILLPEELRQQLGREVLETVPRAEYDRLRNRFDEFIIKVANPIHIVSKPVTAYSHEDENRDE